jgi:hypothetical protein
MTALTHHHRDVAPASPLRITWGENSLRIVGDNVADIAEDPVERLRVEAALHSLIVHGETPEYVMEALDPPTDLSAGQREALALGLAVQHVIATGIPALDPSDVTVTRAVAS